MVLIEMLKKWREGTMNIEEMEARLYEKYPNLSNEELSNLYNEFI